LDLAECELFLTCIFSWLLLLFFLQVSVWPYLRRACGQFAYPVAFPVSLLLFCLLSWYCGLLRLPVILALVPFGVLLLFGAYRNAYARKNWAGQQVYAFIFLLFFLSMLSVRYANPSISYAEKFMDHAFLASIMRVPVVPPLDPWFSSGSLDVYYYLGYWMFGALGIVSGVPSPVVFNLALPTTFASSAVVLYALGRLIAPRFPWLVLGTLLLVNPSFVWQLLQGKALGSLLWDSTRTIPNTINEYPLFSFLWGDVHPHVVGIFNQILFLFLLVYAYLHFSRLDRGGRCMLILLAGASLGSMPPINTWDGVIYAPVTVLFGLLIWSRGRASGGSIHRSLAKNLAAPVRMAREKVGGILSCLKTKTPWTTREIIARVLAAPWSFLVLVPACAVAAYLPFYLQMTTQGIMGVGLVHTPTSPADFLLVHGFFLLVMVLSVAGEVRKRPWLLVLPVLVAIFGYPAAAIAVLPLVYFLVGKWEDPVHILAVVGLSIVILCEVFYLKDNMGETYYRMNTVFKFYIAAWLMMGISALALLSRMLDTRVPRGIFPAWSRWAAVALVSAALVFSPLVLPLNPPYGGGTLDGLAYLSTAHPGDAEAIAYLRSLSGVGGIVEAQGGDYTYYARVSSFTGIPTIIGWPFHEYMWRGDAGGWYGTRLADVRAIYEDPASTIPLMRSYRMTHLYVGDPERERYSVRAGEAGLVLVYDRWGVQIFALPS